MTAGRIITFLDIGTISNAVGTSPASEDPKFSACKAFFDSQEHLLCAAWSAAQLTLATLSATPPSRRERRTPLVQLDPSCIVSRRRNDGTP
ncbi:hypothetical protein MTO96_034599 [Rhipicephalus appendiculatus]